MKVKIISTQHNVKNIDHLRVYNFPSGVNAIIHLYGGEERNNIIIPKRATLIYERLRPLKMGWRARYSKPLRKGWNFMCEKLIDRENCGLVFGHLVEIDESIVYFLHISKIKRSINTMVELGKEIIRQIDSQV